MKTVTNGLGFDSCSDCEGPACIVVKTEFCGKFALCRHHAEQLMKQLSEKLNKTKPCSKT